MGTFQIGLITRTEVASSHGRPRTGVRIVV